MSCFVVLFGFTYQCITDKKHRTSSRAAGQTLRTPQNAVLFHGKKCCDFRLSENAGARRIVPELGKRPLLPVFAAILAAPPRINASRDASRRPDGASPTRSGDGRPMRIRGRG
ncbi:MAG: hypothetical protein DM484_07990, partial [Candidatus Methylumidiphilus alinenensis]